MRQCWRSENGTGLNERSQPPLQFRVNNVRQVHLVVRQAFSPLPNYTERLTTLGSKTKYRKVLIERGDPFNAETAHDGKASAVDDGKVLVTPGNPNLPCDL